MKVYGKKKGDSGCCPGHDKFPPDKYSSRRSDRARARDRHLMHAQARASQKREIEDLLWEEDESFADILMDYAVKEGDE